MSNYSYSQQEEGVIYPVTPEILKANQGRFIETTIEDTGTVTGRLLKYHDTTGMVDLEIIGQYNDFTSVHYTDLLEISLLIQGSALRRRPYFRPSTRPFLSPSRRSIIRLQTMPFPGPIQGPLPGQYSTQAFNPYIMPFTGFYPIAFPVLYPMPYPGLFPIPYSRA
ncbi:hypothetical protein [Wukongibacter sp. M2B1]|uniref:hypothetical protein n=1 Tax=Wukongibacter sp. M2B1 TaxID=3088895 RepID=UPI003D7ACD5F